MHKVVLSSTFNMSLGFIPVIITIILCELITQDTAIYIGTATGIGYSLYALNRLGKRIPNFILYISTSTLVLVSIAASISDYFVPLGSLPLTLEVSILIPMLILYLHKKRFINYFLKEKGSCSQKLIAQGAESAVVSAKIVLILGVIHFVAISLFILVGDRSKGEECLFTKFLCEYLPPIVFIICIFLNQAGIRYFNRLIAHMEYVPIVNKQGDVIGKSLTVEAVNKKNAYINPVIRIAISTHGMLFLSRRSSTCTYNKGRTDCPMECYLRYGETLAQGAERIIRNTFPNAGEELKPSFSILYHFENKQTNRLVYLFILEIENDEILCDPCFKEGKLWRFQQIAENIGKKFFGDCLELEYEHLKTVIDTREKYKES